MTTALKLAREACAKVLPPLSSTYISGAYDDQLEVKAALAAILEVTERAAGLAKRDFRDPAAGIRIATALRKWSTWHDQHPPQARA